MYRHNTRGRRFERCKCRSAGISQSQEREKRIKVFILRVGQVEVKTNSGQYLFALFISERTSVATT